MMDGVLQVVGWRLVAVGFLNIGSERVCTRTRGVEINFGGTGLASPLGNLCYLAELLAASDPLIRAIST
jgi:hypothetical protein